MSYKSAYSSEDAVSDLTAVGLAAGRGYSVGSLRSLVNAAQLQRQRMVEHAGARAAAEARIDEVAAGISARYDADVAAGRMTPDLSERYRAELSTATAPLHDSVHSHTLAAETAAKFHEKLTTRAIPEKTQLRAVLNQYTASRLIPAPSEGSVDLRRTAAMALATGGLQHAATAGLLAVNPNAPAYGTALASAGGALAGRALVRGYDHYSARRAQAELLGEPKTAAFTTGFWEGVAQQFTKVPR